MKYANKRLFSAQQAIADIESAALDITHLKGFCIQAQFTNNTPAAKAFVDGDVSVANDTITESAHGYNTGVKGQLTTDGVLPTGLAAATDYFVIRVDANTYKLATSLVLAQAGTAVNITAAAGGGTHTFTPVALSAIAKIQVSTADPNDNQQTAVWETLTSLNTNITATGTYIQNVADAYYSQVRLQIDMSAGELAVSAVINAKD